MSSQELSRTCQVKLIERNPPPRGGFLFTMFPHQEPCVRGPPSQDLSQVLREGFSYYLISRFHFVPDLVGKDFPTKEHLTRIRIFVENVFTVFFPKRTSKIWILRNEIPQLSVWKLLAQSEKLAHEITWIRNEVKSGDQAILEMKSLD